MYVYNKVKDDGNQTYVIDELMKQIHMGNNKSFVDLLMHYHYLYY